MLHTKVEACQIELVSHPYIEQVQESLFIPQFFQLFLP